MIDATDRKLLGLLSDDARCQYGDLGKNVHLSAPAVHARVKKLEQNGVIQSYTVRLHPARVGKPVCAFIRILTTAQCCDQLAKAMSELPEIEECHSVAGEDCLLVKARTSTPEALQNLLQRIQKVPGFSRTITTMVLKSHFERGILPETE